MNPGPTPKSLADRLIGKYEVHEDGCWIWTAATSSAGYGKVLERREDRRARYISAHVATYRVHRGPIPEGMEIDHLCQVKLCVNPDHLEVVTHLENMRRSQAPGGAHWLRNRLKEVEKQLATAEAYIETLEAKLAGNVRDLDNAPLAAT